MLQSANQKRRIFREAIRKQSHQDLFSEIRERLLAPPSRPQIRERIEVCFQTIKKCAEGDRQTDILKQLIEFKDIALNYGIAETMICQLHFDHKLPRVRRGVLPIQCNWAQLFFYLAHIIEDSRIQIELLYIMTISAYQLRLSLNYNQKEIKQTLQFMINNVPWHYVRQREIGDVHIRLCELIGQLLICAEIVQMPNQLLCKDINVFSVLEAVYRNPIIYTSLQARQVFTEVALLSLFKTKQLILVHPSLESIKTNLNYILFQNFIINQIPLAKKSEYIIRYVQSGCLVSENYLNHLDSFIEQGLDEQQPKYFQMLYFVMKLNDIQIRLETRDMIIFLFGFSSNGDNKIIDTKTWIMIVLKQQIQQCKQWNQKQIVNFLQNWKNAPTLISTISCIVTGNQQNWNIIIYLIFGVIRQCVYNLQESMEDFLGISISSLVQKMFEISQILNDPSL